MEHKSDREGFHKSRPGSTSYRERGDRSKAGVVHKKILPMPIGDKCNPLCPLFKCIRGALFITNKSYRGKLLKEAMCRLSGDKCVGYECQYSSCRINALLPDGRCTKALEKKYRTVSEEELFREMREFEDYDVENL